MMYGHALSYLQHYNNGDFVAENRVNFDHALIGEDKLPETDPEDSSPPFTPE